MKVHETRPSHSAGLTLVELLVVVAVLAILAALAFPAIQRGKGTANATHCKNNLKQIGIGLSQFVLDTGDYPLDLNTELPEKYPDHGRTWETSVKRSGGFPEIVNIGAAGDVFRCRSAIRPAYLPSDSSQGYVSYGYNSHGIVGSPTDLPLGLGGKGGENGAAFAPPVKATEVVKPVEMIAIGDSFFGWRTFIIDGRYGAIGLRFSLSGIEGETTHALKRHSGFGNYVFCDGHVEALRLQRLYLDVAKSGLARLWNLDNEPHLERLK